MTDFVDKYEMRKNLMLAIVRSTFINAVLLVIDATICWTAWHFILVPKFNAPVLSTWEVLGLLYCFRLLMSAFKGKD